MTSKTALFALLAIWGVGLGGSMPVRAEETVGEGSATEIRSAESAAPGGLVDRVWTRQDAGGQPGVIRIFLSDGTLVQDSCWDTHRLSAWKMLTDNKLSWNEDGIEIAAHVAALSPETMTLVLDLKGGPVTEHYAAAPVPSVCPDVPKA